MRRFVAATAVLRAVLIGRLFIAAAATVVSIQVNADTTAALLALGLIATSTFVALAVLDRRPAVLSHRISVLAADTVVTVAVLAISQGGVTYFCHAAGSAALAGVLLGFAGGAVLWAAQTALGLSVAVHLLRSLSEAQRELVAPFLIAVPMLDLVCGLGAAALTTTLYRYMAASVEIAVTAQRSAAASERARLARELHDSVAKTLRGVSFAAVALPSSLRRHPDLAEQLATTVAEGADAAVREARQLLTAMRRDVPDQPFTDTVRNVCAAWSSAGAVDVRLSLGPAEPSLAARYELTQILHEALRNVERHTTATRVDVSLDEIAGNVRLTVHDNGQGFAVPGDLARLSASGSFGVVGMAERARTAGGTLHIHSRPGRGTTVVAEVPADATTGAERVSIR